MILDPLTLLFLLFAAHALCDYPLQGSYLAALKNRHTEIGAKLWPHGLAAHSLIHGAAVTLLTGVPLLGFAETVIHAVTDWAKCEGYIGYHTDQAIHIACKVVWVGAAMAILG